MILTYYHVDVFTQQKFGGNQLAVFFDCDGLTTEQLQTLANEMNFAESSFVLPPTDPANDHQVRIFTPSIEMPMAGHPTIGTAFVLHALERTNGEFLRFEEQVGLVPVAIEPQANTSPRFWMTQRNPTFTDLSISTDAIVQVLRVSAESLHPNLRPQIVDCGVPYLIMPLVSRAAVDQVVIQPHLRQALSPELHNGIYVFALDPTNEQHHAYCRMFGDESLGIVEDVATGSAAGPLACYLTQHGVVGDGVTLGLEQGYAMGRPSQIYARIEQYNGSISKVEVGGHAVYVGQGTLTL